MSCDYHNRTDFRAFDVMVDAIDNASRDDIANALYTADEFSKRDYVSPSKRAIWAEFAKMLRKQLKKY